MKRAGTTLREDLAALKARLPDLPPAEARLLAEGRMAGPMPWVIAIVIFLTVLAAAAGISLARAAQGMDADIAGQVTIQLVEPNPIRRVKQAELIEQRLASLPDVRDFRRVPDREVAALLAPWFGSAGLDPDLPVPLLIDVALAPDVGDAVPAFRAAMADLVPSARVEAHATWLGPLAGLMQALIWFSGLLVTLMAGAVVAIVMLAARGALNTHRATIEVLHLLGATDPQIARLFQRRLGLDALFGGGIGLIAGLIALFFLGDRMGVISAGLTGSAGLGLGGWLALFFIPIIAAALATIAARMTILIALRRML